jgi:hypothetical protein
MQHIVLHDKFITNNSNNENADTTGSNSDSLTAQDSNSNESSRHSTANCTSEIQSMEIERYNYSEGTTSTICNSSVGHGSITTTDIIRVDTSLNQDSDNPVDINASRYNNKNPNP